MVVKVIQRLIIFFLIRKILVNNVNKKVKCDYCGNELNSTNNNSKSIDSTSNKSTSNKSTSNKTYKNNSTSVKIDKNNSTSEISISDQLYVSKYLDLLKSNKINFDIKKQTK